MIGGIISGVFVVAIIAMSNPLAPFQDEYKQTAANQLAFGLIQNSTRIGLLAHEMTNEQREAKGLPPLEWDQAISRIAAMHSQDMVERNYFDHADPEGNHHSDRYLQQGYDCNNASGENIYMYEGILVSYSD